VTVFSVLSLFLLIIFSAVCSMITDIIGKGGNVRKAIQDHTQVRLGIPANVARDQPTNVKVTLAGVKGKVTEAKKIIKEILKHKHHPVTHPDYVHAEVEVPSSLYNVIIGAKGSEIKQMQNNYGVSVHIPNENSIVKNVLVVGPQKGVDTALQHIARIMEKATRDRHAAVDVAESWAADVAEEPQEEWMNQFIHPSQRKAAEPAKESSPAPASTSSSSAPAPAAATSNPANSWAGVISASEGW
jgi:rRNA processing protein Krr1/Pno1